LEQQQVKAFVPRSVPHPPRLRASRLVRRSRRTPSKPVARLVEWHALDPTQRDQEWARLREWVVWLADRYELTVEERLPHCWAEHPGLIEELRALKAWREEIYATRTGPVGQLARYWHTELRATVTAALTVYASGCRAGHRGATRLVATDTALLERWERADPAAGIPPRMLNPHEAPAGRTLSTWSMSAALSRGHAHVLAATVRNIVRYEGCWWANDTAGWTQITDPARARQLTDMATRLAQAEAAVNAHTRDDMTTGDGRLGETET
jgi:hypothetical protein